MSEDTDAPTGGAEGVSAPEVVETPSEATTEQPTVAENADQPDAGDEPEPKRVPWFQKRIDEVTARKYEAEREAAYWRGIAEGKTPAQPQTQPAPEENEPTLEQFDYDEAAYRKAIREHAKRETQTEVRKALAAEQRQASETQKTNQALTKLSEGGTKYPDFMAAVSDLPANEAIRDFILEEPNAADVLYDLGRDPTAAARFNSLPLHLQALELGRRAASPKTATPRTIAPPPPQTVSGLASGIGKTPDQMSMTEYAAWVKERDKPQG